MKTDMPNREQIILKLNEILEHELAGVARYTHYSFMVFGFSRIPVVNWFRSAANETLAHAVEAGEKHGTGLLRSATVKLSVAHRVQSPERRQLPGCVPNYCELHASPRCRA